MEYIEYDFGERKEMVESRNRMTVCGDEVMEVECVKYLGPLYKRTLVLTRL